jgi:hypothetical protein
VVAVSAERYAPAPGYTDRDPWSALLWLAGRQPVHEEPGLWWTRIAPALGTVYAFRSAVEQVRRNHAVQAVLASDPEMAEQMETLDELAEKDRRALRSLASSMLALRRGGFVLPPVPDDVRDRAGELGVDLPTGAEADQWVT